MASKRFPRFSKTHKAVLLILDRWREQRGPTSFCPITPLINHAAFAVGKENRPVSRSFQASFSRSIRTLNESGLIDIRVYHSGRIAAVRLIEKGS